MSHDEAFAALRQRKQAERDATVKVTWRKVSVLTGGGWSGLGPNGQLAYVRHSGLGYPLGWEYGRIMNGVRERAGNAADLAAAKREAAALLGAPGTLEPTNERRTR